MTRELQDIQEKIIATVSIPRIVGTLGELLITDPIKMTEEDLQIPVKKPLIFKED